MSKTIPTDWKHEELEEILFLSKEKYNPQTCDVNFPCIEMEHLEKETSKLLGTANSREQKSIKNKFKKNEVLFGKLRPYLRKFFYTDFEGVCSSEIWVFKNTKKSISKFIYYFIQSPRFSFYACKSTGSRMPRADWNLLKNQSFLLPPLSEQKRIVAVLQTWDKSIEALTQKIQFKKNIKKGLMQELLTGKKRLAGFSKEWKIVRLGDMCDICRGGSPRPIQKFITDEPDGLNWLKIGDIEKGKRFITKTKNKIKKEGLKKTTQVNSGDFILSNSMSFGRPYIMKIQACIHDGWLAFRNIKNDFNKTFLYYKLTTQEVQNEFKSISAGSGVQNLKKETVSEVTVRFPNYEEQTAIAQILTTADNEINALKKKKQILQDQKKFLLNNLITGQVRTPENLTIPEQC